MMQVDEDGKLHSIGVALSTYVYVYGLPSCNTGQGIYNISVYLHYSSIKL